MPALLQAWRAGLFRREQILPNVASGIIVGIVALPLALAFAIASGVKPEQGIYTAIIAGILVSTCGGSPLQIAGPTGAFVVILSGITAKYGVGGLQAATLMAGCMLLLLGIAKLGELIKFIPAPVITGFTAGIGVIIFVGQWEYFFGLPPAPSGHFHEKLLFIVQTLPGLDTPTTALALLSLLIVIYAPSLPGLRRVPGPMVALVVATLIVGLTHASGIRTIGSTFGEIPRGLPSFHLPDLALSQTIELMGPAFAIAMLGAIESLLSATVADGMAGTRHNSNQELIGQGIANIAAPLFGGFAATGAIARTATNIRNGGTSPLSGIVHSLTLVLVLLFLTPLAADVPLAVLAAILFAVAWNMSGVDHFVRMVKRAPRADVVVLLVTFLLTVFTDLVVAVNIGVILAILQFMRRMASSVEVRQPAEYEMKKELAELGMDALPPGVVVFAVDGPFFFAAAESLEHALIAVHAQPPILIIRLRWVPFIDITGLQALEDVIVDLHKHGTRVILCGANARVEGKLERAQIVELIGRENFFKDFAGALLASREVVRS
jgi:SulP family sulfate permease